MAPETATLGPWAFSFLICAMLCGFVLAQRLLYTVVGYLHRFLRR